MQGSQRSAFSATSMALFSYSARLTSSPVSFRNPAAGGCGSFGEVVCSVAGKTRISIAEPISSPNRNTTQRRRELTH